MQPEASGEARLFVSHHSSTYDTALQVERLLAARGVSCWIAPRDVEPGEPFDKAISNAILGSAAILLLFCEKSDRSRHVKRELILADTAARPIIPLRLEAINPGELAYHLADSQWIDWIDRREAVMDRVARQARQYAAVAPVVDGPQPQTHRVVVEPAAARIKAKPWLLAGGAVAAIAAVVATTWMLATRDGEEPTQVAASSEEELATFGAAPMEEEDEVNVEELAADTAPVPGPAQPPPVVITTQPVPTPTNAAGPVERVVDGCRGASSDAEYLICANPLLEDRAREIGVLIRQVRERLVDNPDELRRFNSVQREWFNGVKSRCHDASCIVMQQESRMATLQAMISD